MNCYCQHHDLNVGDFSHICKTSPCRFPHYTLRFHSAESCETNPELKYAKKDPLVGNMHLLVERYMKPCLSGKWSWAKLLNEVKKRPPPRVTTFISHSWAEP